MLIIEFWFWISTLPLSWKKYTMVHLEIILIHLHKVGISFQVSVHSIVQKKWILDRWWMLHSINRFNWRCVHVLIDWPSDWCYLALLFPKVVCGLCSNVLNYVPPGQPQLILILPLGALSGSALAFSCAEGTSVWWIILLGSAEVRVTSDYSELRTALSEDDAYPFDGALIQWLWNPVSGHDPSSEVMMMVSWDEGPPLGLCFAHQTIFIAQSSRSRMVNRTLFLIAQLWRTWLSSVLLQDIC